jgi:uracil-DNA glycosylase
MEPSPDCPLCPRLMAFRDLQRGEHPDWFNSPVPSFGDPDARLLIVGLAPGLRGANRTGRPFTGDYAGDLLYRTLTKFGFAAGEYRADPHDGLMLKDCMITNAVRCVPPENKPMNAKSGPATSSSPPKSRPCLGSLCSSRSAVPPMRRALQP